MRPKGTKRRKGEMMGRRRKGDEGKSHDETRDDDTNLPENHCRQE